MGRVSIRRLHVSHSMYCTSASYAQRPLPSWKIQVPEQQSSLAEHPSALPRHSGADEHTSQVFSQAQYASFSGTQTISLRFGLVWRRNQRQVFILLPQKNRTLSSSSQIPSARGSGNSAEGAALGKESNDSWQLSHVSRQ